MIITKSIRIKAYLLIGILVSEMVFPLGAYALTGGPSQPEVQSFEPVGTSDMVDVFSGDFNYNIPLLDVNGYPINIAYHAGATMDQESSWVGLGWNINPGTINRSMRGLPDDMNGEGVTKEVNMADNWTVGLKGLVNLEVFGADLTKNADALLKYAIKEEGDDKDGEIGVNVGMNLGLKYNRYKGMGYSFGSSVNMSAKFANENGLNAGLAQDYDDDGGLSISPDISASMEGKINEKKNEARRRSFSIGSTVNSEQGLMGLNVGVGSKLPSEKGSGIRSAALSYAGATPTYTPSISTPISFVSTDFNFKTGTEMFGFAGNWALEGTFSNQYIAQRNKSLTKKAYGYMYEDNAPSGDNMADRDYLLDFNRENDGMLMPSTPILPWANHTNDMYSVSAQGVGGSYRLNRNDLAVVHDDYRNTKTGGGRIGVELGAANALKAGVNLGFNYSNSQSGYLDSDKGNMLSKKTGFVKESGEIGYESVYFKDVNELTPQSQEYLNIIGDTSLVSPILSGYEISSIMKEGQALKTLDNSKLKNVSNDRATRSKLFAYKRAAESAYCLDNKIKHYPIGSMSYSKGTLVGEITEDRVTDIRKADHISEVEVLNTDGSRHVFGIPAYNNFQYEKSFRVGADNVDGTSGLVGYIPGVDNILNGSGDKNDIDQYYSATKTPAFAHSYLITGVLSPDYIDLTGNGISDDDFGSAVKFNYSKVNDSYGWRAPYQENRAKHNKGNTSDRFDDMGSYVYGRKEVWHTHSIEGKTHIALFKISERNDGLGVKDENGVKDLTSKSYKLDRIELYSKRELKEFGESAVPIKTVHFKYNYDLCKNVGNQVNATEGKLTLEKIYFTYGKSKKGKRNSYKFSYNKSYNGVEPDYSLLAYDRWSTFSPALSTNGTLPSNAEFPYTEQEKETVDGYAGLWNLSRIELPSGGVINVDYESDDYGYVQDLRAMRMFKLSGFGRWSMSDKVEEPYIVERDKLYEKTNGLESNQTDILIFDLEEPLTDDEAGKAYVQDEYFKDVTSLQVTANINITDGKHEYVKTYVTPLLQDFKAKCGVMPDGLRGWVQIEKERIRDPKKPSKKRQMVNPIAMAGWEYTRMNLSFIINPQSDRKRNESGASLDLISSFKGYFNSIGTFAVGPNRMLMERHFCQTVDFNKSWVRLNDPNKVKKGGGHRVKSIVMNDSWEAINSEDPDASDSEYGQTYSYEITEKSASDETRIVSSGVASYEPFIGRDENPFVQVLPYSQKRKGVPDARYNFEHPVGESFFPGASVGYSNIEVRSIAHEGQASQHRTGYQISEFYTYKDYPVKVKYSKIDNEFSPENIITKIFSQGVSRKNGSAAQGFLIQLNDMHGKPKSNWSFNENNVKLSGVEYKYKQHKEGQLSNEVDAITKAGFIESINMGVTVDYTMDSRFKQDRNFRANADFNLDAFFLGFIPVLIPSGWPSINLSQSQVKTSTVIKVVHTKGLLETTTAFKEGSKISTDNLLYDAETGNVLLTSVDNEFGDKVYSFNYPAHWAYDDGMGQAFQNWGLEIKGLSIDQGYLQSTKSGVDLSDYLFPGDVCELNRPGRSQNKKVWVNKTTDDQLILIDSLGYLVTDKPNTIIDNNTSLRILRSGRKNMAAVSIGSVTSKKNPIKTVGSSKTLDFKEVLATSAVEYKDEWRTDMSLFARYDCDTMPTDVLNTYLNEIDTLISRDYFNSTSVNSYKIPYYQAFCDNDFVYNFETGYCEGFDTLLATYNGTSNDTVKKASRNGVYNSYQTVVYEEISDKKFPIVWKNTSKLKDQDGHVLAVDNKIPGNKWFGSAHPIWKGIGTSNSNIGRLNQAGVWTSNGGNPEDTWIGFQHCLDVPESKKYLIGIGADNDTRLKINGELIVELKYSFHSNFKSWHIFPITLVAGQNVIELEGYNDNSIAAFAAEIYDLDVTDLEDITTETQLDSVLVFSTKNLDGSNFDLGEAGSSAGYSCPTGYSLNLCDGSPKCLKVDTVFKGFFDCDVNLYSQYYPTKDILEILDHRPIDFQASMLTAKVKNDLDEIDTIDMILRSDCDTFYQCETICKITEQAKVVNPFLKGLRGNWRPYKSWTYVEDRDYDALRPDPANDGAFSSYSNFWTKSSEKYKPNYSASKWVWTSEVTEYSPFGMELENKDPLGRYSSALYGYAKTLPTAVASNTRHRQLWYEGFEEYMYQKTLLSDYVCPPWVSPYTRDDFVVMDQTNVNLDETHHHTGNISLKLEAGDSLIQEVPLEVGFLAYPEVALGPYFPSSLTTKDDQIVPFRPDAGKYIFSLWTREELGLEDTLHDNSIFRVEFEDALGNISSKELKSKGLIIEGWQRIEEVVNIPDGTVKMTLMFISESSTSWFDDLRIFPYDGSMKSYAYDARTLRLMAELDENNYATFYEYDLEGNLVRIKKETERGIKTLQESRQHQRTN